MLNYTIKSYKKGSTYNQPHYFIQNKGLNSGRALHNPIPNCFVVTTETNEQREILYYLCQSLQVGECFKYYIIGSVIPFIRIDDVRKVLNTALQNYEKDNWELKVRKLMKIINYEDNLKQQLKTIGQLKIALLRT
ncbi:hypothetical protein BX611_1687 [Lutibacter oceani]|uniref:Uncharacterized protein n=1 Tax=Lutibacter oceani TaxID=1853311 RepID=A0A3D9RX23_9FLAO|nr:hypothetical protein BX611_1687 [Lutibacter oceani]